MWLDNVFVCVCVAVSSFSSITRLLVAWVKRWKKHYTKRPRTRDFAVPFPQPSTYIHTHTHLSD